MLSLYRVSVRRNVVNLNRKYHAKVSALPFALCKDEVIWSVEQGVSSARDEALAGSLMAKYLPFRSKPLQPSDVKAVYVPVWFIDGEVAGNVTKSGVEVSATIFPLNACMPAFHYDPLSTTSFPQRSGLEELAVPFTPELRHQYGIDISCIPFSMSPIPIPEVMKSLSLPQIELPGSVAFDPKSVDFAMLAAYPVLLPIYLLRYNVQIPETGVTKSLTCVVRAHSKASLANVVNGAMEIDGLLQETTGEAPSTPVHRLSHAMDDTTAWETRGIWCGFSTITTSALASSLGWFYDAVTDWLEEMVQSKSNLDALAGYGVDMDHPCVRAFDKVEVNANREFLFMSAKIWANVESLKRGGMRLQMHGKDIDDPEAALAPLKEQVLANHRPQWLQDFRDQQRRGQSAPP